MFKNSKNHINYNLKVSWFKNLSKLHHDSQKGQTLPTAIALGLLGMSAAALALVNAGNEQQNMIAQEGATQAQNITEAGIAKSLTTFTQGNNKYLLLASYNDENGWTAPTADDLDFNGDGSYTTDDIEIHQANGCGEVNGTTQLNTNPDALTFIQNIVDNNTAIDNIQNGVVGSGSSAGTYVVKSYDYEKVNGQGRLIIQGQNSLNTQNKAQYEVTFSVSTSTSTPSGSSSGNAAALMGEDVNTKGTAVFASTVLCTDPVTAGNCGNDMNINSSYCEDGVLSYDTNSDYFNLSYSESAEYLMLQTLLGSTGDNYRAPDNKQVTNITINSMTIPPIPKAPSGANIITVDVGTGVTNSTKPTAINDPIDTSGAAFIELHNQPFRDSFVEETIDGDVYHAIYIKVTNIAGRAGDINVVIDEAQLESIMVGSNNIDTEKMIVRMYINESMILNGNDSIQVYNSAQERISGATEKERKQIASLRIIGGDTDGASAANLTWDMNGTGCLMGHVHAPTANLIMPQGNGCGNSGGETPIDINQVAQSEYGAANVLTIPTNITTPNAFGAIWAKNVTNSSNGGSASFYENPSLTKLLAAEFGDTYSSVTGVGPASTSVQMGAGITSIIREAVQ